MKKTLIALAAMLAFSVPAQARIATWAQTTHWQIEGDNQKLFCMAKTSYLDGTRIWLGLNRKGFQMFIVDPRSTSFKAGDSATFTGRFSNGTIKIFNGTAMSETLFVYEGITAETMLLIAESGYVDIVGKDYRIGLIGSGKAIDHLLDCYKGMING